MLPWWVKFSVITFKFNNPMSFAFGLGGSSKLLSSFEFFALILGHLGSWIADQVVFENIYSHSMEICGGN